ncbi:hypothetical protein [Microcoleus sp. FACHB-672]|uniref:hypothetical protein n=1 Tax=Microcoleus sp. FACHB-672 TaxID=2692825 RepID=UPI0016875A85|nr:hypothetical protein [Microcoleus sp. FACHB-672]MBD2042698.1 hypothetical protein [Microcoleus sp. FACHB-672]
MWDKLYSQKLRLAVIKTTKEISEVLMKTRLAEVNDKITEVIEKWDGPLIDNTSKSHKYFEEDKKDINN